MDQSIAQLLVELAERLEQADSETRAALAPQLHSMIEALRARNEEVPLALKDLDAELTDEVVEDQFDNMPI